MARSDFHFSHSIRVRYSEIDAQGVVYNAHYLSYNDLAITEYMRKLGIIFSVEQAEATGEDLHLVTATVDWKAPARLDQELDLLVRTSGIGTSSMTLLVEIHPKDQDKLLARVASVWVNTNQAARKSTALPADWVTKIRDYEKTLEPVKSSGAA